MAFSLSEIGRGIASDLSFNRIILASLLRREYRKARQEQEDLFRVIAEIQLEKGWWLVPGQQQWKSGETQILGFWIYWPF